ncbi:sensor histidine kinase [Maribellus sediminis]|uniref:sensor histidine kinase n=1 Tax=Maribellus sediminis TaxID=2696285 RepID=UPI001431CDB0|nr:histidine kinase [Maribellus sediminis]
MTISFKNSIQIIIRNRVLQHILFWSLSFLILTNILKVSVDIKPIDVIYSAIFLVPIIAVVYFNLRILMPLFFERQKYAMYSLMILALIAAGSGFYLILFDKWIDYIFEGYYFIAFYSFWDISLYFAIYLVLTSLLHLARGWFLLQEMETEKQKAELKALQTQINPHFLFNSLNSIYSLARKSSKQVPDKIVQLSDLLRHIIYDTDRDFIPLEKEIRMISNYIELQNLRTPENNQIQFSVEGDVKGKSIAPMVMLPFVENSFKHGLKGGADNAFVNIRIKVFAKSLNLEIENSKGKAVEPGSLHRGIGVENVKKRLDLIYPGRHKLKIKDEDNAFKVHLRIELTENETELPGS